MDQQGSAETLRSLIETFHLCLEMKIAISRVIITTCCIYILYNEKKKKKFRAYLHVEQFQ